MGEGVGIFGTFWREAAPRESAVLNQMGPGSALKRNGVRLSVGTGDVSKLVMENVPFQVGNNKSFSKHM